MTDEEQKVLNELLDEKDAGFESANRRAFEAFSEWRRRPGMQLSPKQRAWLFGVAERYGVIEAAPSENIFSQLPLKKQAEQRERAARVKMPWEKGELGDEVTRFLVGQNTDGSFVVREVRARFTVSDGKRGYLCTLRRCERSVLVEFVEEAKVYETAMIAFEQKKALEKERRAR